MCWSLFLIKLQAFSPPKKVTPTPVFSCERCEIFKNTYFEKHLRMAAPELSVITGFPYGSGGFYYCRFVNNNR